MGKQIIIAAVDVGKYENIGLAWNIDDKICKKKFIDEFIRKVGNGKGVLAIEGPLFIPADKLADLAKSRKVNDYKIDQIGNMARPWSISSCFPCAIQFLSIFFSNLSNHSFKTKIFTDYNEFIGDNKESGILVCEAFISGGAPELKKDKRKKKMEEYCNNNRIGKHNADAKCAVELLGKLFNDNGCSKVIKEILCEEYEYINIPFLLSREKVDFGKCRKTGIIVKSPKPYFLDDNATGTQEIIEIKFR